ncbi:MAG TPA: SDR family oxidoreductase [Thermoanaerobaculia bacterium]|nr:SDR family oxidoreductase [Thermoanaerobaculia bacterium]
MAKSIQQLFDLSNRTALVTGGSRGLGFEIAEGLAEAGAALMVCARREQWLKPALETFRKRGFRAEGRVCDVSNEQQVQETVAATRKAFGTIDILVNNAGVSWGERPETMTLEQWTRVLDTNLTGAFLFAREAGRQMLEQQRGCIINVASVAGLRSSVHGPHYAGYVSSKAGLMGLTRELAATWGRQGIRVNAIAPGYFHSRLADPVIALVEPSIKERNPIPRVGAAGELKGVAVFLASEASSYITGQVIPVDGGATVV